MIKFEQSITYRNKATGELITVICYEYLGDEKILFCIDKKRITESTLNVEYELFDFEHWNNIITAKIVNDLCVQTELPPFILGRT